MHSYLRNLIPPRSPPRRPILRPQFPSGVLRPGAEDADGSPPQRGVEPVHRLPDAPSAFAVELAPQSRLLDRLGQQLRNHHAALRVAEAIAEQPFAQAHRESGHFAGVIRRGREPGEAPFE